jgi:hypothetical protein
MPHFSSPTLARNQRILIPTTLDDVIPAEHQVRIFDEIMAQIAWQPSEAR